MKKAAGARDAPSLPPLRPRFPSSLAQTAPVQTDGRYRAAQRRTAGKSRGQRARRGSRVSRGRR